MVTKFDICDKVVWFNTTTRKMETGVVRGIQVVPTGMHRDESGEDILDSAMVMYQLDSKMTIAETEAFPTEEDAIEALAQAVDALRSSR